MTIRVNGTTVVDGSRNIIIGSGSTLPASPTAGTVWFDTSDSILKGYNGSSWVNLTSTPTLQAWSWGTNLDSQLGDNTNNTASKSSPVSISGGFTNWIQISMGTFNAAALRSNGTIWTWGNNTYGALGDNTTTIRSSPVSIVGGFTDWTQVNVSGPLAGREMFAIRSTGTAWAWGRNTYGQLGDNTTTVRSSPVSIVGGFTDWIQIDGGRYHAIGVRSNGTAWSWGRNNYGQLGTNNTTNISSPVSVVGGFTDWVQVSGGNLFSVLRRNDGTIWACGRNNDGQLGNNTVVDRSSPVSVVGGFTDWVQISAGGRHTVALRTGGTLWAWGRNQYGQLGNNTATGTSSPVSVVGGFTDWVQISGGNDASAAVRSNGTAWMWGRNNYGQLGTNNTTSSSSPVSVVSGFTDWIQISNGDNSTAAIRSV